MMRQVLGAAAAVLLVAPAFVVAADFALTGQNTTITFVGTKPGGKHEGGFKAVKGTASAQGKDATTLKITLDIDTDSLFSDNPKLTAHLKSPDFFGVKSNPTAKFATTKVEKAGEGYKVSGNLTLLGQTKAITVPAKISASDDGVSVTSTFSIDRTQWGMTYGKGKIDDQVKLSVSINAKK